MPRGHSQARFGFELIDKVVRVAALKCVFIFCTAVLMKTVDIENIRY